MARRYIRKWDEERTALLNNEELFVIKGLGDDNNYFVCLQDQRVDRCPFCGNEKLKNHDLFPKSYFDIVEENGRKHIISIVYQFYKYRCLNKECRHIFSKEIHFASQNDNATFRLENEIAKLVMKGNSYSEISLKFSNMISRQAVGQIFNRWVLDKEEQRKIKNTPKTLAVITGKTDKDLYTIFLNLDDGIRLFDATYGVSSSALLGVFRRFDMNNIKTILSDCNPTVVDTINDLLPGATYIIPVQYWFKLVSEDFAEYSHDILRWSPVRNKENVIMLSESELGYRTSNLKMLFESRPGIIQPYSDFNELRELISNRENPWTISDIDIWTTHVDSGFRSNLETTILRLNTYKDLIYEHERQRNLVPENLYTLTSQVEELISDSRTFSDAQLKARLLYSVPANLDDWRGIPIEDVIAELDKMNLQRRRNRNDYE